MRVSLSQQRLCTDFVWRTMTTEKVIRRNKPGTKAQDWCNWPPADPASLVGLLAAHEIVQQTLQQTKDPQTAIALPAGIDGKVQL